MQVRVSGEGVTLCQRGHPLTGRRANGRHYCVTCNKIRQGLKNPEVPGHSVNVARWDTCNTCGVRIPEQENGSPDVQWLIRHKKGHAA